MWPFKKATLLDDETARWHVDTACWMLRKLGSLRDSTPPRLILPGRGFYRFGKLADHELALAIAKQTKAFAGLSDWPLTLIRMANLPELNPDQDVLDEALDEVPDVALADASDEIIPPSEADKTEIFYTEGYETQPFDFIALIIRHMAWQVISAAAKDTPYEAEEIGALIDVASCLFGFGVFLCDGASHTEWRSGSRFGYSVEIADPERTLPTTELVFDLAIFLTAYEIPADEALRFLKPNLPDMLKIALLDMDKYRREILDARNGF